MFYSLKISWIAVIPLHPCSNFYKSVNRAVSRSALCSTKQKDAKPWCRFIIAASRFQTISSSAMVSISMSIIETCPSLALWIWKNINHLPEMTEEKNPVTADEQMPASPYAGRWVARVRGKIIAQGGTPEQALHAAQKSRHKEKPEILFMPVPLSISPLVDKVHAILPDQEIYLVGGAVRDMLLNRVSPDLDFALPSNGISLARRVANALNANFMVLDEERDTGRVIVTESDGTRIFLDFATYRGGSTLEEDLRARDFTINAIAFDLRTKTLIDPFNGTSDLRIKTIRACSPTSLRDDPVRILRAVRQAAAFEFKIEMETRKTIKQAVSFLPNVSPERQRDELFKILEGKKPDASMRALEMLGVFPYLLPELSALKSVEQSAPHVYNVWEHTLSVLEHLENLLSVLAPGYNAEDANDLFTGLLTLRIGRF